MALFYLNAGIIAAIVIACVGIFEFLAELNHVPTIAASRAVGSVARRQQTAPSSIDMLLDRLSSWIARTLPMSEETHDKMLADLESAGEKDTPEMYRARKITKSLLVLCVGSPMFLIRAWLGIVVVVAAGIMYYMDSRSLHTRQAIYREKIESDLPNFVAHIEKMLPFSHDVIYLFESYLETATPTLKNEIERTVADMRSGNQETALSRMERRINSPMVSETCRGLMSVMRGDVSTVFWGNLGIRLADMRRQNARQKAIRITTKVHYLSLPVYLCFILIWGEVMITIVLDAMSGFLI